jgi:hypothetical protein
MTAATEFKSKRVKKGLYEYRGFEIRKNEFDPSGAPHIRQRADHKNWLVYKDGTQRAACYTIADAKSNIDRIIVHITKLQDRGN